MLRSLSSAVSGLGNQQTALDVIGNNIANVDTVGYKAQRVTFEESFSELLSGATRATSSSGGTNPVQVGLGMSVGSIDTLTAQGDLSSTENVLDLAISGTAYFGVSDGDATYYTRDGSFSLDSAGQIVTSTGYILQGMMADDDGEFPSGTTIGDITIPYSQQSPAKATSEVTFARNLDSDSEAKGTVTYSQTFLHHATDGTNSTTDDSLYALYDSDGDSLNIEGGDKITISCTVNGTDTEVTVVVGDGSGEIDTLSELVATINSTINSGSVSVITDATNSNCGAIAITPSVDVDNLQITSDNSLSSSYLTKALNVTSRMEAGSTYYTDTLRAPAESTDNLSELYDDEGESLGLEDGDVLSVTALVGDESVDSTDDGFSITYDSSSTTMQDLMTMIQDTLKLGATDGTEDENASVSLNAAGSDDGIPDGTLVIRGIAGESFGLSSISITASNSNSDDPSPTVFNANMSFTEEQAAEDVGVYDTSITVYDETGAEHVLTMTFVATATSGVWDWSISFEDGETIVKGGSGQLTFGQDGSVSSFTFDDSASQLVVDPNNGSNQMRITLDVGSPGDFEGLTQFASDTTASATSQDGYTTGSLEDISIDEEGYITGAFSNGTTQTLAQIMLVDFTNPAGLTRVGDSLFSVSSNSGDPVYGEPGSSSSSTLQAGALESSNVDLAEEFTNMIVTQRAYQANARVITVSDSMLEELVALKR
ncbi:MAG TPA: flagellar hook-basal body complex protein [Fibrobacteraceae bacterium]|nr:flagellar hook-basal body complex protein [Fibrobacteraceae bacterium]